MRSHRRIILLFIYWWILAIKSICSAHSTFMPIIYLSKYWIYFIISYWYSIFTIEAFLEVKISLTKQLLFSLLPQVKHTHTLYLFPKFYFEIQSPDIIFYYYYPTCAFIFFVSVIISRSVIYEGTNPVLQLHRQKAIK